MYSMLTTAVNTSKPSKTKTPTTGKTVTIRQIKHHDTWYQKVKIPTTKKINMLQMEFKCGHLKC